jgi:ribbon-helix-helix CopG family protein
MQQVTVYLSDDLLAWVDEQATVSKRSRSKHIEWLLDRTRHIPAFSHEQRYILSSQKLCYNGKHHFISGDPATSDKCNCGMFVLGEVQR